MIRNILSVVVGLISSFFVIEVIGKIGFILNPPPAAMNFSTPDDVKAYISSLPFIIIIGYSVGSFVGGFIASSIATNKKTANAISVGGVLLGIGALNLFSIHRPLWVVILTLLVFFPCSYLGSVVSNKLFSKEKI